DSLAQSVALLSAAGQWEQASYLYRDMEEVLAEGVKYNLVQAEKEDPKNQPKAVEIRQQADKAKVVLEQNLAQAPPEVREDLQKAMKGPPGDPGKSKGKGWGAMNQGP